MSNSIYLPIDQLVNGRIDCDMAADFVELSALFANDSTTLLSDLANQNSVVAEEDYTSLDDEIEDEILHGTLSRIEDRLKSLDSIYPFKLDSTGDLLKCILSEDFGQIAYIVSLILSNLPPLSPILSDFDSRPTEEGERRLREFFQYFATAALAAEVQGMAWSFGFPRPDGSGFLAKLEQIWQILGDGRVQPQIGASKFPKDDKVDVFAARLHRDRLPGFLLAVAQVTTGKNASEKSLKGHLSAFKGSWFGPQPVTNFIPYMIVPFARPNDKFFDDVRKMGNVLHRLRMPLRVAEAGQLLAKEKDIKIEGYDQLSEATRWVIDYRERARTSVTPL